MTEVRLERVNLPADAVAYAAAVARRVRGKNARAVTLVTDNLDLVIRRMPAWSSLAYDTTGLNGCTYACGDVVAVWLTPWYRDRRDVVRTLAHELAHGVGNRRVSHSLPFRRLYARVLPLVGTLFEERYEATRECRRTVATYATRLRARGARDAMRREVTGHVDAWYESLRVFGHTVRSSTEVNK